MPYQIRKVGNKWAIVRKRDNKIVGYSTTARNAHISAWIREREHKKKTGEK